MAEMFLINIVTLFLEREKKQAQAAVHGSQEVYLDLALCSMRVCLNSNGKLFFSYVKKNK